MNGWGWLCLKDEYNLLKLMHIHAHTLLNSFLCVGRIKKKSRLNGRIKKKIHGAAE
jgi:hypothetical protein